ncbi:susd5 [Pungitius sinensis]
MLGCFKSTVLLFGCLAFLVGTSVVNADGRVFVLDLRNSSGLHGFRAAEGACASRQGRLASAQELHHAVVECFFSPCTRGWLYGGTVGTTVCDVVGSARKAVDVRTENATEDAAHLDAFCIKDKGVPCGDPPSFPNVRLQGHSGYEMGDELMYTCVPGHAMPSGHSAFSLLCDSCGEWYGLVEICVKDETESPVDYEETYSYGEAERHNEKPEEAHGQVFKEVHRAGYQDQGKSLEQQETSFSVEKKHQDHHGERGVGGVGGDVIGRPIEGAVEEADEEYRVVEDFAGHPRVQQETKKVVETSAATEAPVSSLSQKHLFWFLPEAFQEEVHPVSGNPVTETTQRARGAQSEESKESDSRETRHHQRPADDDHDDDQGGRDDPDTDGRDDHDDSDREEPDGHDDSRQDDLDDHDSRRRKDDDRAEHQIPAQHDDLDARDSHEGHSDRDDHDDHADHYDMGEHEGGRDRVRSHEYGDTYDEHESYEERDNVTRGGEDREHPNGSEEHPEPDAREEHYDPGEDHHDRDTDHDDHEHDDHDSYDDHDSHEDDDDSPQRVVSSMAAGGHQNGTLKRAKGEDDTWLDGHPVVPGGKEMGDSTTADTERGTILRATDKPNEVEIRGPGHYTSAPQVAESPTTMTASNQGGAEEAWDGFTIDAAPSQAWDSPSSSDSLDYDSQQAAPTHFWQGDLTERPFLARGPVPPMRDGVVTEEDLVHNLPGEVGERGEMEGEVGEATCTGDDCPPHPPSSSSRGPTVAAIIVALCAVAAAVAVGVWCYRRQQQKSSMYEMNGKGQSQDRQGQHIEMQQKV